MSLAPAPVCDEAVPATVAVQPLQRGSTLSPAVAIGAAGRAAAAQTLAATGSPGEAGGRNLSVRIRLLIDRVGGVSALAQYGGVSEGTVRNWRDGHSDMSRERCVALAQALDISLLWLVNGEGAMAAEPRAPAAPGLTGGTPTHAEGAAAMSRSRRSAIEPQQLAAALRLLQSYIGLAGGSLDSPQRAEMLAQLYELLERAGEPGHAGRLIAFNATLGGLLRANQRALIS